jgi:hypothetical protein
MTAGEADSTTSLTSGKERYLDESVTVCPENLELGIDSNEDAEAIELPYEYRTIRSRCALFMLVAVVMFFFITCLMGLLFFDEEPKDAADACKKRSVIFLCLVVLPLYAVLESRYLVRVDEDGITLRCVRTEFILWEDIARIEIYKISDPTLTTRTRPSLCLISHDHKCLRIEIRSKYRATEHLVTVLKLIRARKPELLHRD